MHNLYCHKKKKYTLGSFAYSNLKFTANFLQPFPLLYGGFSYKVIKEKSHGLRNSGSGCKNTSMNRERYHASGREQDSSQKKVSVIIL